MPQTIDIPSPSSTDCETVITALETAAVFGAKGDEGEAMRWLRRAAESAGEAGDDRRALLLTRRAADLREALSSRKPSALPRPASRPNLSGSNRATLSLVRSPPADDGSRAAGRVAVTASPSRPGVFEVRLLSDGESPAAGSTEALLVMLDPSSTILSRSRAP